MGINEFWKLIIKGGDNGDDKSIRVEQPTTEHLRTEMTKV
jgi:hypothetical protein